MRDFSNTSIEQLAAIAAEHLLQQGIEVVLVGGLAVEIYTENLYLTKDIDMVNTNYQKPKVMHKAMEALPHKKWSQRKTTRPSSRKPLRTDASRLNEINSWSLGVMVLAALTI